MHNTYSLVDKQTSQQPKAKAILTNSPVPGSGNTSLLQTRFQKTNTLPQNSALQQHQSVATDGEPWKLVRWRNNTSRQDVQFIGELKVNKSTLPPSSMDAVTLHDKKISLRIPGVSLM